MSSLYGHIRKELCNAGIESGEARAIALLLLEKVCGLTTAEALMADIEDAADGGTKVLEMAKRVANGEPVQYVIGEADFCGLTLFVKSGVLIPRPETQELVGWVAEDSINSIENIGRQGKILDICTGSGCIAIALAKQFPDAEVEAWDVSDEALEVAKKNTEKCGVRVALRKVDVLDEGAVAKTMRDTLDVIVSNPPYICEEEAAEIEAHVLEHEPRLALFVPDEDPLIFYRQIACMGMNILRDGGRLYFEINRRFGKEVAEMLVGMGYTGVELRQDFYGNDRMIKAIKS